MFFLRTAARALASLPPPGPGAPFSPLPPAPPVPVPAFAAAQQPAASPFACQPAAVQLVANATHASVLLTHWSASAADAQPIRGRTPFAFATWTQAATAAPSPSAPAAEAFLALRAADPGMYPGTCSLAAAGRRFPYAENFTRAPPVAPPGSDTLRLAPNTLQAAGCACARAYIRQGAPVLEQGCGGGAGFYAPNAETSSPWLIEQTVQPGGPCSLRTQALLLVSPPEALPGAAITAGDTRIDAALWVVEVASEAAPGQPAPAFQIICYLISEKDWSLGRITAK